MQITGDEIYSATENWTSIFSPTTNLMQSILFQPLECHFLPRLHTGKR